MKSISIITGLLLLASISFGQTQAELNKKAVNAYDGLHLSLGYDGSLAVKAAQVFLGEGRKVIQFCEKG